MSASLKKKKRFSLKTCRGEKAQQSWGDTVAERNKDGWNNEMGVGGQNKRQERKENKNEGIQGKTHRRKQRS